MAVLRHSLFPACMNAAVALTLPNGFAPRLLPTRRLTADPTHVTAARAGRVAFIAFIKHLNVRIQHQTAPPGNLPEGISPNYSASASMTLSSSVQAV